jgi:PAS domain S-box-containing protein
MKINILEVIDFEKVDVLLEGFNKTTGFVTAILDLDGKILSKSGWRQLCTQFHRINPETSKMCTVSDTVLVGKMAEGEKYHFYKCLNGLVDVAVPIVIKGEHIANLFSGQFFFEEPDRSFFKMQAEKYGFDQKKYLDALENVPVVSKEKVITTMDFLLNMTQLISEMTFQKLEQTELNKTIRESEEKFRSITEQTSDFISITDGRGNVTYASSASEKLFQFDPEEMCGRNFIEFLDEPEIPRALELLSDVLKGSTGISIEFSMKRKDGSIFIAELNGSKFQQDLMTGTLVVIRDITQRKQAEQKVLESQDELRKALELSYQSRQALLSVLEDQRLADREIQRLNAELEQRVMQRTAQLEAANKELETFTYSVSHDLKAPLRGIDGYSKLLLDIHSKNLDEEAKTFISTIRSSTMQMNLLIEDLLEYSRLERSNLTNKKVKLMDLIGSTTTFFKNDLRNGNFILKLAIPDVELMADEKGLTIVLRNLLENAIKFTKDQTNPTIEIGLDEQPTSWIIRVKDNGIGFDMKYHQRIFEIFQRLHRAEDYDGTGIGLAMVSKAMQRMNGKVWAESIPGEGSTFILEIPKLQPYENE